MRTISIKGTGKAKRDPDLVIFDISTSAQSEVYADSVVESNRLVNKLKQAFEDMGFKKDDLKTVNYHTHPVYEYVEVGVVNKRSKRELECFEVSHDLKIEFDLDNDKINEVLNCLKDFRNSVDFNIRFSVKDKDSMKRDVILDATKNARANAEILAEASSVRLGDLIKIEYNWSDFHFYSIADYDCNMDVSKEYSPYMEFTPDSIEISDNVSFIWEIK